jgi:hypothetical protein
MSGGKAARQMSPSENAPLNYPADFDAVFTIAIQEEDLLVYSIHTNI